MDRETAITEIRSRWREIIPTITAPAKMSVKHEPSWICPICNHGANGDGITYNPKSKDKCGLKCFGSCSFSGDIIDLMMRANNIDFLTALNQCASVLGITIEKEYIKTPAAPAGISNKSITAAPAATPETKTKPNNDAAIAMPAAAPKDYSEYYLSCCRYLLEDINAEGARDYLESRGISLATAKAYHLGYDAAWRSPTAIERGSNPPASARIILPTSKSHYVARAISSTVDKKYQKMNEGSAKIFNAGILLQDDIKEVFIVEGMFDALSIIQVGVDAVALNSTSNTEMLINILKTHRNKLSPKLKLLLAMDADESGKAATEELRQGLDAINISYMPVNVTADGCKDANETLVKQGLEQYTETILKAIASAGAKPDNVESYINNFMSDDIQKFKRVIKTGFEDLDKQSGGLYAGLYVIAAGTSLGKTTFALQMCDQIATAGNDVLFFSLEQSRLELVSKSIARTAAQQDLEHAVSSLSIRRGYLPQNILKAAEDYQNAVKDRLSIIEGNFDCNINYICDYVKNYIKANKTTPVIVIDYLQILQPPADDKGKTTATTKETVDTTITELKRMSRSLNLTIFVISSVNRAGYLMPIDYESLKESGGIEYTADVIWGLQLQCLNDEIFAQEKKLKEKRERIKKEKAATPRKIELVCLKNRYGIANYSTLFDYRPANDLYINTGSRDFSRDSSISLLDSWKKEQEEA